MKLFAPEGFWVLTDEAKEEISNGCGPKGSIGFLVPDTIYGLSVTPCCDIHDYMYHIGSKESDRIDADDVFLNNMVRMVTAETKYIWLLKLRLRRVRIYYGAVKRFGGPAFWDAKNEDGQFKEVNAKT